MQVFYSDYQKQNYQAAEVNNIPGIQQATAHTAVMKIDAQHFNIVIPFALEHGQFANCPKAKIQQQAGKGAY